MIAWRSTIPSDAVGDLQLQGSLVQCGHMKTYRIDKRIKLPAPQHRAGDGTPSKTSATLDLLTVGDSFVIKDPVEAMASEKIVRDRNHRERKKGREHRFATRRVKDGVRVWRIS